MCTVTYLPTGKKEFIFTSNRDEAPNRSATELIKKSEYGKVLLYPQDAQAKGTWICTSNTNQLVCILNGAFEKHEQKPPYRLSRGVMALNFFSFPYAEDFFEQYRFQGIEPFTMIVFDDGTLYEFRWDGLTKHVKKLDTEKSYLWASATLYSKEWQDKRQKWFSDWKAETKVVNRNTVLDFHKNAGEGNSPFNLLMRYKDVVRTTSITNIIKNADQMNMHFENLSEAAIKNEILEFQVRHV